MRYETSASFRRALEERLRQHSQASAMPLARLRKMVAFERFLARLVTAQPDSWVLKGRLALIPSWRARPHHSGCGFALA